MIIENYFQMVGLPRCGGAAPFRCGTDRSKNPLNAGLGHRIAMTLPVNCLLEMPRP